MLGTEFLKSLLKLFQLLFFNHTLIEPNRSVVACWMYVFFTPRKLSVLDKEWCSLILMHLDTPTCLRTQSHSPPGTPDASHKCGVGACDLFPRFSSFSSVVHRIQESTEAYTGHKPAARGGDSHDRSERFFQDRDFHLFGVGGMSHSPSTQMCLFHAPRGSQTQTFRVFFKVSLHRLLLIKLILVLSPPQTPKWSRKSLPSNRALVIQMSSIDTGARRSCKPPVTSLPHKRRSSVQSSSEYIRIQM